MYVCQLVKRYVDQELDNHVYTMFDRQNMLVSFYDEIIESILQMIVRLDLNVEHDESTVSERHRCKCKEKSSTNILRE
jgi:hypothetical protein